MTANPYMLKTSKKIKKKIQSKPLPPSKIALACLLLKCCIHLSFSRRENYEDNQGEGNTIQT